MSGISVYSRLRLTGALVLDNDTGEFPANPQIGTMVIHQQTLYAYMGISGIINWYPLAKLPNNYMHDQTAPAVEWTVQHNLEMADVWYQIQDDNGQFIFASEVVKIDENRFKLIFSEPTQGKVLVLATGTNPVAPNGPVTVTLSDIMDWPQSVTATELGYLDGLTDSVQNLLNNEIQARINGDANLAAQLASFITASSVATLTNKTYQDPVFRGSVTEEVREITGTNAQLTTINGTMMHWTLTGNSVLTDGLSNGQTLMLMVDDGEGFGITWPVGMLWIGGSVPVLSASGYTVFAVWKMNGVLCGANIGNTAGV